MLGNGSSGPVPLVDEIVPKSLFALTHYSYFDLPSQSGEMNDLDELSWWALPPWQQRLSASCAEPDANVKVFVRLMLKPVM
jgi:hypothetical protein